MSVESITKTPDEPTSVMPTDVSPTIVPGEPPKTSDEPAKPTDMPPKMPDEPSKVSEPKVTDEPAAAKMSVESTTKTSDEPAKVSSDVPPPSMKKSTESVAVVSGVRLQPRPVAVNSFKDVRPLLKKTLRQLNHPLIGKLEKQSGLDREKLFCIGVALMALYLLAFPGNTLLSNLIGIVYPAYCTTMAVHTRNKVDNIQWLVYWCAFALCSLADHVMASSALIFPLYLVLKTFGLLYLALPQTLGAHNVYVNYVDSLVDSLGKKRKAK